MRNFGLKMSSRNEQALKLLRPSLARPYSYLTSRVPIKSNDIIMHLVESSRKSPLFEQKIAII